MTQLSARRARLLAELTDAHLMHAATEPERLAALDALNAGQQVVVLDGVTIDFRHPDLPSGQYRPDPEWVNSNHQSGLRGLWNILDDPTPADLERCARVGDKVKVDQVSLESLPRAGIGDTEIDNTGARCFVVIERPDGARSPPIGPIWFLRMESIHSVDPERFLEVLAGRFERLWERVEEEVQEGSYSAVAEESLNFLENGTPGYLPSQAELLSNAALFGYSLARAEAERGIVPLAAGATRTAEQRRSAGALGANAVRRDDWRRAALDIWQSDPTLTVHAVASLIVETPGDASGIRSISRAIKGLKPT